MKTLHMFIKSLSSYVSEGPNGSVPVKDQAITLTNAYQDIDAMTR